MKIIQSSPRSKKDRSSRNSSNDKQSGDDYAQATIDASTDNELKSMARTSRPPKKRNCSSKKRPDFSNNDSLVSSGSSTPEEEIDYDTRNLEAMPKDEVLEALPSGKKRRRSELLAEKASEPLALVIDPAKKEFNEQFARGLRLLAMREHSVKEITKKLFDKVEAFDRAEGSHSAEGSDNVERSATIYAVVDDLVKKKYLSDERFTEVYIRSRANRGFGPVKIKAELKDKGVSHNFIQDYLNQGAAVWFDNAQAQYKKKYGNVPISDYSGWTKRARFMQSRGFTMEQIQVTVPQFSSD